MIRLCRGGRARGRKARGGWSVSLGPSLATFLRSVTLGASQTWEAAAAAEAEASPIRCGRLSRSDRSLGRDEMRWREREGGRGTDCPSRPWSASSRTGASDYRSDEKSTPISNLYHENHEQVKTRVLEVKRVDLEYNFLDSGWPRLVWSLGKRRKGRAWLEYSGCRGGRTRTDGRTGRGFYDAEIMAMRKNKRKGAAAERPTRMRSRFNAPSTDPMGVLLASCCMYAFTKSSQLGYKGKSFFKSYSGR